ncbi:response regulator [Deinococcus sp.]|uniref:response regulator n=1 Tax=Deinococcus sp. TaxID=47478 RepID=UPI0025C4D89E|nr:response regulator [Deinococcus sp.]
MPNILIVDDSVSVRKALEITLRTHAMDSKSVVSAEAALEFLDTDEHAQARCDLMMVDVIMPGMSGIELCRQIKANPHYADLPVILMSGNVDDEIRLQAREAGADGVLRKPFKADQLIPMVQAALTEHPQAKVVSLPDGATELSDAEQTALFDQGDLQALTETLQQYEDHPRVRDVVILDRQGQPIKQTGNLLPENIQLFARFFTNTAGVLGKQMLNEDIQEVSIRYGVHEMVIHNLPSHFLVVLMGEDGSAKALQA